MKRKDHWEEVYRTKAPHQVSWYPPEARLSREMITRLAPGREARILDVGSGASMLVDRLLADGYEHIWTLDLSEAALDLARGRLGVLGERVEWITADVLAADLPPSAFDVWHDRALFHFLTDAADRARYVRQVKRAVRPGGILIVATFAEDGPTRCSGLDVMRYSADALHDEFGQEFELLESRREQHLTPSGAVQAFSYCACRYAPRVGARVG
jgi:SAM-dependent methyltransferase